MRTRYLSWKSDLSLEHVFTQSAKIEYPTPWRQGCVYLTNLTDESNRMGLIYHRMKTCHKPARTQCLTPAPFNLKTRISEMGGKPFWVFDKEIVFSNDIDNCLYQIKWLDNESDSQEQGSPTITKLTRTVDENESRHYAEFNLLNSEWALCVVEYNHPDYTESRHALAVLNMQFGESDPKILDISSDFFSNLVVDQNRQRIAWVQWQHPNMPWDSTELWTVRYELNDSGVNLLSPQRINFGLDEPECAAVCQLLFTYDGRLCCAVDFANQAPSASKNFWNIWVCEFPDEERYENVLQPKKLVAKQLTFGQQEFGYPHWQYQDVRLVQLDRDTLLGIASGAQRDSLVRIDLQRGVLVEIESSAIYFQFLSAAKEKEQNFAMVLARYADRAEAVLGIDGTRLIAEPYMVRDNVMLKNEISQPKHIHFNSRGGQTAYAYFYSPKNSQYPKQKMADVAPPLLVMVHGGPTARAYGYFDLQKQFWTQRGFAVLDVNHRGSSGYGRAFRDSLYGSWGDADCDDIIAAIESVCSRGWANPRQVCIRGKSAGGYAVLRALTEYPDRFCAGACYYGIGSLVTLAEVTHKFESRYTGQLVGEVYHPASALQVESAFQTRSPINNVANIKSPMIIFQGLLDKIVPPSVAQEMVTALNKHSIPHKYVEYAAEGHGFRHPQINIDAWQQELSFYKRHVIG